jgi:hypothetical protein
MSDIRRAYGVPAKRGARVRFTTAPKAVDGTIVGSRGQYLRIRWHDSGQVHTHHPTWMLVYLEDKTGLVRAADRCAATVPAKVGPIAPKSCRRPGA